MVAGPYKSTLEQRNRLSSAQSSFWKELEKAKEGAVMAGLVVALFAALDFLVSGFYLLTSEFFFTYYGFPAIPLMYYLHKAYRIARARPLGTLTCDRCHNGFYLGEDWVCGHCETRYGFFRNPLHLDPTFLEQCRHHDCRRTPHSLWCYGCERPIIFDERYFNASPKEFAYLAAHRPTEKPRQTSSLDERRARLKINP
jgi:hypothetical protein